MKNHLSAMKSLNQFRQQGDPLANEIINVLDRQKTHLLFSLNAQYIAFFTIEVLYNTGSYQYTNIIVLG